MRKRQLVPLEINLFKRLQEMEDALATDLELSTISKDIAYYISDLYSKVVVDGKTQNRKLLERIDFQEAMSLRNTAEELKRRLNRPEFEPLLNDYPLNILNFDQLNRVGACKAFMTLEELETACMVMDVLDKHWESWLDELTDITLMYFEMDGFVRSLEPKLVDDWRLSLCRNHIIEGVEASNRTIQSIIRGQLLNATQQEVNAYLANKESYIDRSALFTGNTMMTEAGIMDIIGGYVETFHSVTVKDEKTCKTCQAIEEEQTADPVPMDEYAPGVTAPPFHAFCRRYIEVNWKEGNEDDSD
jgi:hypothetical protein